MPSGTEGTVISEAMLGIVGRPFGAMVSFPVAESDIRKWAVAVHHPEAPPARFWDHSAARRGLHAELVAPEDFNPFAWMTSEGPRNETRDDPDWLERSFGIHGPGLRFQLNGGMATEYGSVIRPGDVVTSVSTVTSYFEREGRLGLMLLTSIEERWTNQDDDLVQTRQLTWIRY